MARTNAQIKHRVKTQPHGQHVGANGKWHVGAHADCHMCGWRGPKSICQCGCPGDGANTVHGGEIGHGPCGQCGAKKCPKFSWAGYYPAYQKVMDAFISKEQ